LKGINPHQASVELSIRAQKWPDRLHRDTLTTGECEVRVPWPKIRLDPGGERGVGHPFVQLEEMRMSAPDTQPNYFRAAFAWKSSNPAQRKEEARELNPE
jgi:hypothetical protein